MNRLLVLCLAAALVTACKKKEPEATPSIDPAAAQANAAEPSDDTVEQAAADDETSEPEAVEQAAHADEEEKLELEASMVEPYIELRKALIAIGLSTKAKLEELEKEKLHEGGALDVATLMKKTSDIQEEATKATEDATKKSGLTDAQIKALGEISTQISLANMVKKDDPTAIWEKGIEEAKASGKGTPEELAKAQAELDAMKSRFEKTLRAAEAREKYGDEIVDAMFARADEFEALMVGALKQ